MQTGDFVFSRAGRDKGTAYLVVQTKKAAVWVTDGRTHGKERPKKKNPRHIQPTSAHLTEAQRERLTGEKGISNEEIAEILGKYVQGLQKLRK